MYQSSRTLPCARRLLNAVSSQSVTTLFTENRRVGAISCKIIISIALMQLSMPISIQLCMLAGCHAHVMPGSTTRSSFLSIGIAGDVDIAEKRQYDHQIPPRSITTP